ncbi:MAG: hypothetical protein HC906_03690 [Bacteroidales bacterium]|nr:hypothetical protein [Bacteroidales bacterium]
MKSKAVLLNLICLLVLAGVICHSYIHENKSLSYKTDTIFPEETVNKSIERESITFILGEDDDPYYIEATKFLFAE